MRVSAEESLFEGLGCLGRCCDEEKESAVIPSQTRSLKSQTLSLSNRFAHTKIKLAEIIIILDDMYNLDA